jgi:hypothetical protein
MDVIDKPFQRRGSISNSFVGSIFEEIAFRYFVETEGVTLQKCFPVEVGIASKKKLRKFDLGSESPAILVECKSHRWTETGNMPSAKMTVWNESMFYFHLAPARFRKVLFVVKDTHARRQISLADYYVARNSHLIPLDVSIIEFDEVQESARIVYPSRK